MDSTAFVIKGISGSGKSSRVFQLIEFFRSRGETISPLINTQNYKRQRVGIVLEEQRLAIFGKLYKSGTMIRWQGLDAVTFGFNGSEGISKFLADQAKYYNFIVEGAGVMDSYRFRPKFLYEECNFEKIFMQCYNYTSEQKELYIERTLLRSGRPPKKDSMWGKRKAYELEEAKSIADQQEIGKDRIELSYDLSDLPIYDFGIKYLKFTGQRNLVRSFKEFVKEFDYVNRNNYKQHTIESKPLF